jgi:ADP-heptose:LPS heptosyltransferase
MRSRPEKILALQFKYFGDAVLLTSALRALRGKFPAAEIHLLVPAEIAPLFQHLPWLTRVWPMPRRRGRASLRETWPLLRALRREKFDRSVDFASNDRGAILSFLIGAKQRLGWDERGGFVGRRFSYHQRVVPEKNPPHEATRLAQLLSGWQIPPPDSLEAEIRADAALADAARKILPDERAVICHVASSQQKKEWPLAHWVIFHRLATAAGHKIVFTTARGRREAALMADLKNLLNLTGKLPTPLILPEIAELPLFLAVLARAGVFVSGDTGPLHFAAGLGVPTISLFGPTSPARWAPVGARHQILTGGVCGCDGHSVNCTAARHCLAEISPEQVLAALQKITGRN